MGDSLLNLNAEEVLIGLNDLLIGQRFVAFQMVKAFPIYHVAVVKLRDELAALPPELLKRPLSELLKETDVTRDNWARAIFYLREAMYWCPTAGTDMGAARSIVDEHFVPSLAETTVPYSENVSRAEQHKGHLQADAPVLAKIPTPDGRNLAEWVQDFVAAGLKMGPLLSARGDVYADVSVRTAVGTLRNEAVSILTELRQTIQREVKYLGATLPANIEQQIFGMFDTLSELAKERNAASKKADEATKTEQQ